MLSRVTISTVALNVQHLDAATAFYRDVIGLIERRRTGDTVILGTSTHDLVELRRATAASAGAGAEGDAGTGLFHLALRVPERTALGTWLSEVLSRPDARRYVTGASDHGVSEAVYLDDPEGNGVEVYVDRPRDRWPRSPDGGIEMYTRPLDLDGLLAAAYAGGGEGRGAARESDAGATGIDPLPDGTDMGHVHLMVSDLDAAERFYVDTLGLDLVQRFGDSALFVSTDGYHHHFGLNTWRSAGAPPLLPGAPGLAEVRMEARIDGEIDGATAADGIVVVRDPDGIPLVIKPQEQ